MAHSRGDPSLSDRTTGLQLLLVLVQVVLGVVVGLLLGRVLVLAVLAVVQLLAFRISLARKLLE
jgi:hypothetical protein